MQLTFLGSGSGLSAPHSVDNYHSNILISHHESHLLIDCGGDIQRSLRDAEFTYNDITSVYISHLHADHIGGLEWLGFSHKFDESCSKPVLYIHQDLTDRLWQHSLSGGMSSLEGEPSSLETYFDVAPLTESAGFEWQGVQFDLVETEHVYDDKTLVPSYGLQFTLGGIPIFLTTDARFTPEQHLPYYERAAIIFQDCELFEKSSGVHAHYSELMSLPAEIRQKMWLYHYSDNGHMPYAKADGFQGFITKGQSFEF